MTKDKIKIYSLEIILLIILFFALFVSNIFNKMVLATVLFIYMMVVLFVLKKRKIISMYDKQVSFLMFGLAIIYLAVFYLMGVYFGFYRAPVRFGFFAILNYIIPFTVIVVSSEVIRFMFISQKVKVSKIFSFISMVMIDLILYAQIYDMSKIDDFLALIGFVLFASVSCNLLYNYVSGRFGYKPIIIYRLITVLYAYIIPIVPDVFVFFRSILRMIYPYFIYIFLEYTYSTVNLATDYINKKTRIIGTTVLFLFITLLTCVISCQFRFGVLVIGSGSMSGTIDKGDVIVFDTKDTASEGDIVVFLSENKQVVHRVVEKKIVNGEYRYYTKGDANQQMDAGYITNKDIVGISKFKVKYVGYPTLWVRDLFSK